MGVSQARLRKLMDGHRGRRGVAHKVRALVGTIDSPLWALSGEILERGSELYRIAELTARGGTSGRLVNVTPRVIARYARVLDELGALGAAS